MMASHIKKDEDNSSYSEELKTSQSTEDHVYSHRSDEFIDIHGTHSSSQVGSCLETDNSISDNETKSKVFQECVDSNAQSTSRQNSADDLKLPVQETEGFNIGGTVVHHNSDDEYESAEDGEISDDDEDEFIPTTEMLSLDDEQSEAPKQTSSAETHISDGSGDTNECESEDTSAENEDVLTVPEEDEAEEDDPLEARKESEMSLTPEEKEERKIKSQQMKDEGNTRFRNGEYDDAILSYTSALDLCPLEFHKERSIMYSNRAACKMKQEDYEDAIADSSKALELHPHYLKAMLRRAELYEKTDKLDEALKDYQKVVEMDPSQHAARAACLKLAEQIKDRNEKMKEEMMGKLKDLGNMVLRPFGLSTNNFQLQQDPNTGSYSVQFKQNAPGNGS
ncbi:hypothetical protein EGW08_010594 [Elysia chlorotica]|uniref:Tetratricopeptide repeat protein 1 n=1 Tax=Elysia chlorotica TaxID=188477 RepID=A0A433TJD1_ELYCH|nr:hypothetical protein EGW08_010594 [Elysia chlorotica]